MFYSLKTLQIMKTLFLSISLILIVAFGLTSCESVNEAQKNADEFYKNMQSGYYGVAVRFFSQGMFDEYGEEKLLELIKNRDKVWGKIESYSKYGFHTSTNEGGTFVTLKFRVQSEKGLVFERLEFVKKGDEYKLNGYFFNPDQSKIDDM